MMNHAEEIELFVHSCFDMYCLDFDKHFNEWVYDDEFEEEDEDGFPTGGHFAVPPLVIGENINMELLTQAATTLGVSTEALMQMDLDAVRCWYVKYPYFQLRKQFDAARYHSLYFANSSDNMMRDDICSDNLSPENPRRYKGNIKARLVELLKEYDRVMPGCFHEGSELTRLSIETDNFTNYEQIDEFVEAYLSMVSRARELFYRLWNEELPDAEVKEYNFLVSVLGMKDVGYSPADPIYYETAKKFAPIYKQEGYTDYASYITYRGANFPEFYACKEFYDNPELVERTVQEFPRMKSEIGMMAVFAKNFKCTFTWSDEPEPPIDASFDEFVVGTLLAYGDDASSWYHRVYVPKTKDELYGDEKYIAICERLSAPASQGGLKLPVPDYKQKPDVGIKRMEARVMRGSQNG